MSLLQAQLERININTQDIVQKCEEVSGRYGKKKGHLCHLLRKITFATWYFFLYFLLYLASVSLSPVQPKIWRPGFCLDCLLLEYYYWLWDIGDALVLPTCLHNLLGEPYETHYGVIDKGPELESQLTNIIAAHFYSIWRGMVRV